MKPTAFTYSLIAAATLTLVACGGGGGGTAGTGAPAAPTSTTAALTAVPVTVMDGLISGATVCADTNANGVCETTEPQATTNATGQATLQVPAAQVNTAPLVAQVPVGAVDKDTGAVTTAYTLAAPAPTGAASAVISALTTQVHQRMRSNNETRETAEAALKTQLGVTAANVSLMGDYVHERDNGDDNDADYRKLGDVARLLVLSTQQSKTQAGCAVTQTASSGFEGKEGNDEGVVRPFPFVTTTSVPTTTALPTRSYEEMDNEMENHVERNLGTNLGVLRQHAEELEGSCTGSVAARDCDDQFRARAQQLTVACTATGTTTLPAPAPKPAASAPAPAASTPAPAASTPAPVASAPAPAASAPAPVASAPATPAPVTQTAAQIGKTLYNQSYSGFSCGNSSCHGAPPAFNKIGNAVDPNRIQWAISNNRGLMGTIYGTSLSAQDLQNIAAYVAAPF